MPTIRLLTIISLLIFCYYFTYYIYSGIINPIPTLGDDWDYHIPISLSILDGSFLNPPCYSYFARFYPGSAEAINSLLILLHIPLTLSSIIAIIALFFACYSLGTLFRLKRDYALLFAITFCSLTVIFRWANKVSIDAWLTVFFSLGIIILEKLQKNVFHFLALGFVLGMLIGSKYTGLVYCFVLVLIYGKKLLATINPLRLIVFFIPFFLFGLFWYLRNYLAIHNSIIPSCFTNPTSCIPHGYSVYLWQEVFRHPRLVFDAFFGEYKIWTVTPFFLIGYLFLKKKWKKYPRGFFTLSLVGLINFFFYFFLPTSPESWQTVSTIRYTLPAFLPMMLSLFMLAQQYKKEVFVGYMTIANMLPTLSMAYYPKLLLVYFPLTIIIVSFYRKKSRV